MKVVILAGGFGTRLSEETKNKPKPMVEIGRKPILWHIMKKYASFGINEFIICCGYKADVIRNYFEENFTSSEDDFGVVYETEKENPTEKWNVRLVDTGLNTMTGGRLKKVEKYLDKQTFCFTYSDTLNDVNITSLIDFHYKQKKLATVTVCQPPGKYGILQLENDRVIDFKEKPRGDGNWVNGGYFVLEFKVLDYIKNDTTVWEQEPMNHLTKECQLAAYRHTGFYQPMDTISDKNHLQKLWESNNPKWKNW